MGYTARRVDYYYTTVSGEPGGAYELLTHLAKQGVNFLALTSVPLGPDTLQLTIFPQDPLKLQSAARSAGLAINGPHYAVLVQGDDEVGAVARILERLRSAGVQPYASSGVSDGRGGFGHVLYLRAEDADRAVRVLTG